MNSENKYVYILSRDLYIVGCWSDDDDDRLISSITIGAFMSLKAATRRAKKEALKDFGSLYEKQRSHIDEVTEHFFTEDNCKDGGASFHIPYNYDEYYSYNIEKIALLDHEEE